MAFLSVWYIQYEALESWYERQNMSALFVRFRCSGCGQGRDIRLEQAPRNGDRTLAEEGTYECPNCVACGNVTNIHVYQTFVRSGPVRDVCGREYEILFSECFVSRSENKG